jgi:hypothetical protein
MKKPRESLWDATIREKYSDASERLARKTVAEKNGEHTAKNLEQIWKRLNEEEKLFFEFLFCLIRYWVKLNETYLHIPHPNGHRQRAKSVTTSIIYVTVGNQKEADLIASTIVEE